MHATVEVGKSRLQGVADLQRRLVPAGSGFKTGLHHQRPGQVRTGIGDVAHHVGSERTAARSGQAIHELGDRGVVPTAGAGCRPQAAELRRVPPLGAKLKRLGNQLVHRAHSVLRPGPRWT